MVIGVGTDIIEVRRFLGKQSPRFLARVYHKHELAAHPNLSPQTLAGLFAAKEAVVKAMGCGFSGFWPADVEITRAASGRPGVRLHGMAGELLRRLGRRRGRGRPRVAVSISHSGGYAVAVAVVV